MKISVIVPVYNDPEGLERCLGALARQHDRDFEVIVVDDGSPRPCADVCARFDVRFVRLAENTGPGTARNEGVKHADGDILAFVDADCAAPPDWLTRIREALEPDDIVAVAGGFDRTIGDNFIRRQRLYEVRFYHPAVRCFVNSFITANFAIKTSVFHKAGGFPALHIGEDLILGYNLMRLGYEVLWLPDLRVAQAFRRSVWTYFKQQSVWAAHILRLTLTYPDVHLMKWSPRRSSPLCQMGLEAVLALLLPFSRPTVVWATVWLAALGVLVALNWPFLRFCQREGSWFFAGQVLVTTIFVRNVAWIAGAAWTALQHPIRSVSCLAWLLIAGARHRQQEA